MHKRFSFIAAIGLVLAGLFVFSGGVKSDSAIFNPSSGVDNTAGTMKVLSSADLVQVGVSDNSRNGSAANWVYGSTYDENKYIEFDFTPNIPADAVISSVQVTHQYYTQATLSGAKLEVWYGNNFQDIPISLPSKTGSGGEILETKDISAIVSSPTITNALKIRFLAYRSNTLSSVANLKTFHNYISLLINYVLLTPTPSDTTLMVSDTISPAASASITVTPIPTPSNTPTPIISVIETPLSTPIPLVLPDADPEDIPSIPEALTPTPFETPSPSPSISPIASPSLSPTPNITPSASFEPTPNPLVAAIVPPKIVYHWIRKNILPTVSPSVLPRPASRLQKIKSGVVRIWHILATYLRKARR